MRMTEPPDLPLPLMEQAVAESERDASRFRIDELSSSHVDSRGFQFDRSTWAGLVIRNWRNLRRILLHELLHAFAVGR